MKCSGILLSICLIGAAIASGAGDLNELRYAASSVETKMRLFRGKIFDVQFTRISPEDEPALYDIWCTAEEANFDDFCDLAYLVGKISKKTVWKSRYLIFEDSPGSIVIGRMFWKYRTTTKVCRTFNTLVDGDKQYEQYLERELVNPPPGKTVMNLTEALSKKTLNYLALRTKIWRRKRDKQTLEWSKWKEAGTLEF